MPRLVRLLDLPLDAWPGGIGGSRELAYAPDGEGGWTWRLQLAELNVGMPIPAEVGLQRHAVLAQGAGIDITIDGVTHRTAYGETVDTPGALVGDLRLVDGPVRLLQLHSLDGLPTSMEIVDLRGDEVMEPGTIAVVLTGAGLQVRAHEGTPHVIQAFDAAIATKQPLFLHGTGTYARVHVPVDSPFGVRIADPEMHCAPVPGSVPA